MGIIHKKLENTTLIIEMVKRCFGMLVMAVAVMLMLASPGRALASGAGGIGGRRTKKIAGIK